MAGVIALRIDPGVERNKLAPNGVAVSVDQIGHAGWASRAQLFHRLGVSAVGCVHLDIGIQAAKAQRVLALGPRDIRLNLDGVLRAAVRQAAVAGRRGIFQSRHLNRPAGIQIDWRHKHEVGGIGQRCVERVRGVKACKARLQAAKEAGAECVRQRVKVALVKRGIAYVIFRVRAVHRGAVLLHDALAAHAEEHLRLVRRVVVGASNQCIGVLRNAATGIIRRVECNLVKNRRRGGNLSDSVELRVTKVGCL